jgi:general secretion pathway protein E
MSAKGKVTKLLGEILVDQGLITKDTLRLGLAHQKQLNKTSTKQYSLGDLLVHNKKITQEQLLAALATQRSKQHVEFRAKNELEEIYGVLSYQRAPAGDSERFVESEYEANILVAESQDEGRPFILVTRTFQETMFNTVLLVRARVRKAYTEDDGKASNIITLNATKDVLTLYRHDSTVLPEANEANDKTDLELEFENLVKKAYESKAVDLHFFRRVDNCRVRLRVWGAMRDHEDWEPKKADDILSVGFSSFGKGGLYSHWKSDEGQRLRMQIVYSQYITLDCRYEHAPGDDGAYHACIRILANDRRDIRKLINFRHLGFTSAQTRAMEAAASGASGMVILAGPTGSGKSTTLAGIVKYINRNDDVNILTVESPIERELPAFQTAVSDDDGADPKEFARAIKSTLRRDPDVLMVGEIRDDMSASAAATGVQTGHTLLTTVHAQSGIEIVERLSSPALALPSQTIGSPSFLAILIFQMLLPVLDDATKIKLTSSNIDKYLAIDVKSRLLSLVPNIDTANIYVRGKSSAAPEGVSGMTICAEVVVPDETMRRMFRKMQLAEALEHWMELGRIENEGLPLDDRIIGLRASSHAVGKMLQGMIDPRDIEVAFGHINLLSNDFI